MRIDLRRFALVVLLAPATAARAQECACDHELALGVTQADGAALGVGPGDVVCVEAGERPFLRISGFVGSEEAPVTVINCGGQVVIHNEDRAYALVIEGQSRYVRVTGTGAAGIEHGFDVSAPDREPYAGVGVWIQGRASDIEVDHMEIHHTGFAGVMAKTDPGCDDRAAWDGYVQRNVHLHHLWVHDTGGEGFYVGSTQAMGYMRTCDDGPVTIPAHFLEGIEIDHVLIEDTGWDGAQIGFARSGCSFHDNVMRRVGLEGVMYQTQGLQIGAYSSCEVRRNVLSDGPAMGIIVLDSADSLFADNVIARFGANGIYANLRGLVTSARYRFVHNTIVSPGEAAIQVFGDGVEGAEAWNNFVIGGGDIAAGGDVGIEIADNVFAASIAEAGVAGDDDFHLADGSPARGAGRDGTSDGFAYDLEGRMRAVPPSAGAYEHAADAPPIPDGGAPIEHDGGRRDARAPSDAGTAASEGGCGCRASGASSGLPLGSLFAALALVRFGRRSTRRRADAVVRARPGA